MTHYLNLLSYIVLVGGVFAPGPIIWLSIKICCRVVENVTFIPEIYALKSICIQFLVKYTTPFICKHMIFEFSQKWRTSKKFFFMLKNIPSPFLAHLSRRLMVSL